MAVLSLAVYLPASRLCWGVWLLILLSGLLLLSGCDTQDRQDEFAAEAGRPPAGFTETTAGGEVVAEDEDDWRTAPVYFGAVRVDPASPNPATAGDLISIPITTFPSDRVPGRLSLRALNNADRFFEIQSLELQGSGLYGFSFDTAVLPRRGLQRVFLFDGVGELVSYGDILVE